MTQQLLCIYFEENKNLTANKKCTLAAFSKKIHKATFGFFIKIVLEH